MNNNIVFQPIGVIRSEHVVTQETPIQPVYARDCLGRVELLPEFADGLHDIDGFSHIYLIYHFDRAEAPKLRVKPFLQDTERGVFSTRAPCRPNAIGLSVVELLSREGNVLHFAGEATWGAEPATVGGAYASGVRAAERILGTPVDLAAFAERRGRR